MSGTSRKPKHGSKAETRSIMGVDTWLEAWCIYASALTAAKPQLALDLFRYLNYIVLASHRFKLYACLQYDTHADQAKYGL